VKSKEGKKLAFCIYCKTSYSTKRKSNLIDHVKTTKHRLALVAVKGFFITIFSIKWQKVFIRNFIK